MSVEKKVPEIRFKGFSGEWAEKELGEITSKIGSGKTPKGGDSTYVLEGVPLIRSQNIYNNLVNLKNVAYITPQTHEDMKNSSVFKNDVLLNITGASIGRSAVYAFSSEANVNQHVCIIRLYEGYNSAFTQLHLTSTKGQLLIDNNQAGGAREGLNFQQIGRMNFSFASKEEQTAIGNTFQKLDNLINQHQQKHDKLSNIKKAMLEKMFPKQGETVPEIRFKGFSGEWEEREFGCDLVSVQTGTNLLGSSRNSGRPLIKMGNIQRGYFSFEKVERLETSIEVEKENIANYGDFLFNTRNTLELVGKGATWMGESNEFAFNNNIARFTLNGINTIFFNYLYNTQRMTKQVQARAMGTTSVAAIYPQNLKSIYYALPIIEEQTAIGNYFQKLDALINQHQQQITKLNNIKQACLSKMFV